MPPISCGPAQPGRMTPAEQTAHLRDRLTALGFDDVRFAAVGPGPLAPLRAWLDAGHHADMHWMERTVDKRLDPTLVLPGARSFILLGVNYWSESLRRPRAAAGSFPTWARYALHEDYHDTIKPGLVAARLARSGWSGGSSGVSDIGGVLARRAGPAGGSLSDRPARRRRRIPRVSRQVDTMGSPT